MTTPPLHESTVLRLTDAVAHASVGQRTLLLCLRTQRYFRLDGVAARALQLMHDGHSVGSIVSHIVSEYEVPAHAAREDLFGLLQQLLDSGLVYHHDERAQDA